jgi:hypothetical protein
MDVAKASLVIMLLSFGDTAVAGARPAPDWVQQIEPGTWAAISLNTLSDVDPAKDPEINPRHPRLPPWSPAGQGPVLNVWNGGVFATSFGASGALLVIGGGHAAYYGNEIYAFDLATRRWQRLTNPYPSPYFPVTDGIWPDGTPSVPHTYDQVDYHPGTNSFVMMRTQHHNLGGYNTPIVFMFSLDGLLPPGTNANRDLNKKNWRYSSVNPLDHARSGGWSAYDSKRDLLWAHGGDGPRNAFASYDPEPVDKNGRHGVFQNYPIRSNIINGGAAYDPENDLILFTEFRAAPDIWAIDLSKPGAGRDGNVRILQSGTPPLLEESHGWEWSPTRKAFVYYRRGSGVYELKQQQQDWRTSPWHWTDLTSARNTVVPEGERSNGTNGVHSKFRLATYSDAEIALVVSEIDQAVYAFRIPSPGTDSRPRPPAELSAR